MIMSEIKVCAVVVTYNRKEQLKECLKALLDQTRPLDALLIVDNGSTDNTPELLLEQAYIDHLPKNDITAPYLISSIKTVRKQVGGHLQDESKQETYRDYDLNVMYVRMHKNTGGAGGFHEGVKMGYELGNDWLWLMDDDGLPDKDALSNLLRNKSKGNFLNALVLDVEERDKLSFSLFSPKNKLPIKTKSEAFENSEDGAIQGQANPFNGTLISNTLISKIGLPMKEMFIWGDEAEYQERAMRSGLGVATIISAIHYHPKARTKQLEIPITSLNITWSGIPFKDYCNIRNTVYIHKKYYKKSVLTTMMKYLIFFAFKPNLAGFGIWFNATFDGLFNRWGREKNYL
jgi:rhamnopyranosyl-N-acetylglucosaminyl-diphospho-decaprenol beta-1,3/1,4-galactofuranosyltransferase